MPISPLPAGGPHERRRSQFPDPYPTYDYQTNSSQHTDGLNDADEMNLYVLNPQADSPFGFGDLEWLYRQQDVDGNSLTSRLAQLAPVSFTNSIDGQRRRRLFATDSWETEQLRLGERQPGRLVPDTTSRNGSWFNTRTRGFPYLGRRHPRSANPPVAGPPRQQDQPQLPAAGLQRSQRADPPEVDQRRLSN